ncbi:MAG: amino acid racemase [Brevibacterium sp.]|uniref:aspartate/glutamate racemase family protein n=2 Tax=Brevibacterium TaxID=1696 RepID=UPI00186635E1|nr:amino acid racemase [Brevibacterium aurantiacum]MDN5833078.1 amino acid racemase [Brevibacterium sp.]MDN6122703.1 amino acid racemase [Brevibacterium sp.]MDN6134819.1 amino acid racemase [Brevibacterium sp.]MDN6156776.1 amino acid racemase [Brevibacterium sp.]MDN6188560.1 amino acid racemase [Brevibacterium sp.]
MRRIGLLGGMSWHSSIEYYTKINQAVAERLGGHHSARILLDSTDFADIRDLQITEDWAGADASLTATAQRLVNGGAEAVAIATNLMHKCAPAVEAAVDAPLIHIVDAIAATAKRQGHSTLAVLGTKWTMLDGFYTERLEEQGIRTLVPDEPTCLEVDQIIFDELTQGVFTDASRARYVEIMNDLKARGADAVALSCTEIGLLVPPETAPLPAIDSVDAHVAAIVEWMMANVTAIQ